MAWLAGTASLIMDGPAADGEIYDMEQLVAAHRTMPIQHLDKSDEPEQWAVYQCKGDRRGPSCAEESSIYRKPPRAKSKCWGRELRECGWK